MPKLITVVVQRSSAKLTWTQGFASLAGPGPPYAVVQVQQIMISGTTTKYAPPILIYSAL